MIRGLEEQRQRQQAAAEDAAALLARTELLHDELLQRWEKQKQQSAERKEQDVSGWSIPFVRARRVRS